MRNMEINEMTVKRFMVDDAGNVKDSNNSNLVKLTIKNTKNEVNISKSSITTSEELPGAHLVVKD